MLANRAPAYANERDISDLLWGVERDMRAGEAETRDVAPAHGCDQATASAG